MNSDKPTLRHLERIAYIPGYEGLYAITSYGRVWSPTKVDRAGKTRKAKWLRPRLCEHNGYYMVLLTDHYGQKTTRTVHSLVYFTFNHGEQKETYVKEVHHIDDNKLNNRLENLAHLLKGTHRRRRTMNL